MKQVKEALQVDEALDTSIGDRIWDDETFEEQISSALISLYETKITGQRSNHPRQRLDEMVLKRARFEGVYIPNHNRLIIADQFDNYYQLPRTASLSIDSTKTIKKKETDIDAYRLHTYVERVSSLPKGFERTGGGVIYRVVRMFALPSGGVDGMVGYMTVDKFGNVYACDFNYGSPTQMEFEPHVLEQMKFVGTAALNYEADKFHVWTIEAQESEAKCTVGVDREQVKSLLYARSLPLTATGRKRPILHLVAAHTRRLKEGIDIEIGDFLRGVKKVEMNGTIFTVNAPEQLKRDRT